MAENHVLVFELRTPRTGAVPGEGHHRERDNGRTGEKTRDQLARDRHEVRHGESGHIGVLLALEASITLKQKSRFVNGRVAKILTCFSNQLIESKRRKPQQE